MNIKKIGIVGYGSLGQYLTEKIIEDAHFEIGFIYNRDITKIPTIISQDLVLENLDNFVNYPVDLIVEVAHPQISEKYGIAFLEHADYMAGSPTAFANIDFEKNIRTFCSQEKSHALYVPKGAMWYLSRVIEMAKANRLKEMHVAMKKHPLSIHYYGPLDKPLNKIEVETTLYDGKVRQLCEYAPNNVNTMAVAALASNLGLDNVNAQLIVDPSLEAHIIEVELYGEGEVGKRYFEKAQRYNPAKTGAVTGSATYQSFWDSVKKCSGHNNGLHFC